MVGRACLGGRARQGMVAIQDIVARQLRAWWRAGHGGRVVYGGRSKQGMVAGQGKAGHGVRAGKGRAWC
jgi:hypothetical protein